MSASFDMKMLYVFYWFFLRPMHLFCLLTLRMLKVLIFLTGNITLSYADMLVINDIDVQLKFRKPVAGCKSINSCFASSDELEFCCKNSCLSERSFVLYIV
ncbi:hypothetical protein ACF0H5_005244 [Mactra antiquata]